MAGSSACASPRTNIRPIVTLAKRRAVGSGLGTGAIDLARSPAPVPNLFGLADLDVRLVGLLDPSEKRLEAFGFTESLNGMEVLFEFVMGEAGVDLLVTGLTEAGDRTVLAVLWDQVVSRRLDCAPAEFTAGHRCRFVLGSTDSSVRTALLD